MPAFVYLSDEGSMTITRRDFLEGVLIGAGGLAAAPLVAACAPRGRGSAAGVPAREGSDEYARAHALRDGHRWALPAASGPLHDCIVIGGGISGLTAAWKLRRLGVGDVRVFEKEPDLGGMARSGRAAATPFSLATGYTVFPYNDGLVELYTDLGMVTGHDAEGEPQVDPRYIVHGPVNSAYVGGRWVRDAWESGLRNLPLPTRVLDQLEAFRADLVAWNDYEGGDGRSAFDTPTDASTEDADVRALDRVTLAQYVAGKGWDPAVSAFFDPYCRSSLGTTHDRVSAWAALGFLCAEFGPTLAQPGGNAYLARAIAQRLGPDTLATGRMAVRVWQEQDECRVAWLDGAEAAVARAKQVVWAAPRYLARHVLADLPRERGVEAAEFKYTPYLVANLHVRETPAGLGYDNWIHLEGHPFTDVIVADWAGLRDPGSAPLARPNVLTVYMPLLGEHRREELLGTPLEVYEDQIFAGLERVLPGVSRTVTTFELYRWGHAMLAPGPGFVFGAARRNAARPLERVSFACTDCDGVPAFENAVGVGMRAATEVATRLRV